MHAPHVSIVVPTHNRAERLPAALDALARQDWPPEAMEVLVVADGCSDGTARVVQDWRPPFAARLVEQPQQGPAVARNRGAAEARGRLVVFLDDDIRAAPGFVRAHVKAHGGEPGRVVIGYLPAAVKGNDFFSIALRGWWDAMFQAMWKPGHRFTFRDLLSGNFSIERALFEAMGGFQAELRCHEDYELGLRLLEAGARFRFAPGALGVHDERTDLGASLRRKFEEGRADVWLLGKRPDLVRALPLSYMTAETRRRQLLRKLAVTAPRVGDALAWIFRQRLRAYEYLRLRFRWRDLLEDLFFYHYWRGAMAVGGPPDVVALHREEAHAAPPVTAIDLATGLDAAEARLDLERPSAIRLQYGTHLVGELPPMPWAEPLEGRHLRALLAEPFVEPYTRALALTGQLPAFVDVDRVIAECLPAAGAVAEANAIT